MHTKRALKPWIVAAFALLLPLLLWARTSAPPTGRTGAPGESTCTSCHSATTGTGTVTITFPGGLTYTPGTTQRIVVKVTDSTATKWGYEVTAVQTASTSTGAGTFSTPDAFSGIQTSGTKSYGGHTSSGTFAGQATSATWQLDWTPPATNVGNVQLYIAGMGANNNGSSSGDRTYTANYTLTPAASAPSVAAAPTSLSFTFTQGGANPAAQSVAISSSGTALNYTASTATSWLSVGSPTGTTPGNVSVSANPGSLAPGTYNGSVSIAATGAANTPISVPVSLTVNAAPNLAASPASLTFTGQAGGAAPAAQAVAISSTGAALSYTTSKSATWLTVTPASGTTPGSLSVSVNQTGLAAGTYTGNVTVTSSSAGNSPFNIPVTFTVTAPPSLAANPSSLTFSAQTGGSAPPSQTVAISSSGSALSYTTASSATWLTATPASGSTPGNVTVSVNQSGLAAGTYNGNVTITSSGAANSPLSIPVTLTVSTSPSLGLSPTSLSFSYQIGGTTPAAQSVALTSSSGILNFTTAKSAATWLSVTPASGTTPGSMSVSVAPTGLAAGTYTGSITVTAAGASNSPATVPVTLTVTPAPTMTLTPASLTFTGQAGGAAPASQSVNVASSGTAFNYTTSTSASWLTASASGTTPGSISVTANQSGLAAGTYTGTVTVTAAAAGNSPQTVAVTFTVTPPPPPNMTLTPTSLTFSYQTGSAAPAAKTVAVASTGTAFNYTTSTSAAWLTATASGTTPGSVSVGINTTGLTAGSYNGTVTVTSAGAANSPQTVAVSLTVTAPPSLTASPSSLSYSFTIGGTNPAAQTLTVGSTGASLSYTASSSAAWLSVTPASGATTGSVSVAVNPASLVAGTYNGSVTITATGAANSPMTVPVTLTVAPAGGQLLTLSPQNLSFAYSAGAGNPAAQRINVGSSSGSALDFRALVDQPWLQITSAIGPTPGYIMVGVSADGMAAGTYSGNITFLSSTAQNTPLVVPVTLTVSNGTMTLNPANLSFSYRIGGTAPAAQSVSIGSTSSLSFTATSSAAWLTATPGTGTAPGNVSIGVNATGLSAGNYTGSVTIAANGAANSPQTISVSLTVTSATGTAVTASPNAMTFYYRPGDPTPAAKSVAVNATAATAFTAASAGGNWLSATPSSGTTNASLSVSVNPTGMPSGTYSGMLTLTPTGGAATAVPVTLIISSAATGTGGMKLDAAPYTQDATGTNGVWAGWVYGAGIASQPGDISQALVLIKNGSSANSAQAGAQIPGAAGIALNELGFDIRTGQCTASGPHFAVITSDNVAHVLACGTGVVQASPAAGWTRVRFDLTKALPGITPGATVNSLSIVLSAGPDSNSGFVVIDNIDVNGNLIAKP